MRPRLSPREHDHWRSSYLTEMAPGDDESGLGQTPVSTGRDEVRRLFYLPRRLDSHLVHKITEPGRFGSMMLAVRGFSKRPSGHGV